MDDQENLVIDLISQPKNPICRSVAILQARTSSTRLPGKVLLPVAGLPLVVLAARRAANKGRAVIVAISNDVSDDTLAKILAEAGINFHRGSLHNVLERIVGALEGFSDDTFVFRLTADNVFPDGLLLDEMEKEFIQQDVSYLCCSSETSGLPHGVSAELTRAKCLRDAAKNVSSPYDLEHVTPYIRRTLGETHLTQYRHLNHGNFRCTVDCFDDYLVIQQAFDGAKDPVGIPFLELIDGLAKAPFQPLQPATVNKLVLGTAQLGLNYGITNKLGKPQQATSEHLIKSAIANGALFIDTARAYGTSEEVIGNTLKSGWSGRAKVITKLSPLNDCPEDANPRTVNAFVDASIYQSFAFLRTQKIDVLMLHRASHLTDWSGAVWTRLLEHQAGGLLGTLGVSIQSPRELRQALAWPGVEFIQMPFNVLDWRWDELIQIIKKTKQQRPLQIHARSVLLQGLLTTRSSENWSKANVADPDAVSKWLLAQTLRAGRKNVADFCISFVKSIDWIDGVVVGMESQEQLVENIQIFSGPNLSDHQIREISLNRPYIDEKSLNPAFWNN